jgi:DNA-binding NtrC family response regulator
MARLLQHNWPGNVRELAAVLENALLETANGIIHPEDLALPTGMETPPEQQIQMPMEMRSGSLNLDTVIHQHVQYVLDRNRGNKLRAARQLGISRSTLYRILGNENALEP